MKRFALMISLLLSILCMTQAKDRIVERPPFFSSEFLKYRDRQNCHE